MDKAVRIIADPGATWHVPEAREKEDLSRCFRLIEAAAAAGCWGIKFQLLRPAMYPDESEEARLVSKYSLPAEWLPDLAYWAHQHGLQFGCTAYRVEDVDVLDPHVDFHKIAGFESQHRVLLHRIRDTGKPLFVTFSLGEHPRWGPPGEMPLYGISAYPTPLAETHLARLQDWYTPFGFSDHTTGNLAGQLAVALGASVLEKHLKLQSTPANNPDAPTALTPTGLKNYVRAIRQAEEALGDQHWRGPSPSERVAHRYDPKTGRRGTA